MKVDIYDATITDGAREAGVQLSVRDRLRIALRLAEMGAAFVEGGWPGGRGGDDEIFREARRLEMGGARLCACASIGELRPALRCGAPAVGLAVPAAGRGSAGLALAVRTVKREQRAALVQLLGFFEAFQRSRDAALALVATAAGAGADAVVLCDTTGGALPREVEGAVLAARRTVRRTAIGVRARDDAGMAVANSVAAVSRGATLVAATVNGYGERCGAADLVAVAAALELKMGVRALAAGQLKRLSSLAHFVADLADREIPRDQPYVGRDAFAAGSGAGAPHVDPEVVGNRAEPAMADERGHPDALRAARALGLPARGEAQARRVLRRLATWERRGFRYEGAEASFELLLRALGGRRRRYFQVLAYRVVDVHRGEHTFSEATVELAIGRDRVHTAALGVGPIHALDTALRRALERHYPELSDMSVVQSRSRNLGASGGTSGLVRVLLDSADARDRWGTAGVSGNLIEACCQALVDAIEYKLLKDDVAPAGAGARARGPA